MKTDVHAMRVAGSLCASLLCAISSCVCSAKKPLQYGGAAHEAELVHTTPPGGGQGPRASHLAHNKTSRQNGGTHGGHPALHMHSFTVRLGLRSSLGNGQATFGHEPHNILSGRQSKHDDGAHLGSD